MKEIFRFFHKCFFALQKFKSFFILSIFFDALLQGIKLIEPWILASMLDSLYKNSKDVFLQKVATLSLIIIMQITLLFTNGCFSKKSYSFLCDNKRYIDNMTITLDGPAEIHNARRPLVVGNSFSTIVNNLFVRTFCSRLNIFSICLVTYHITFDKNPKPSKSYNTAM